MGKNRGFKPQGIANPLLLARLSRPVPTGPTIRERLERESRPTWEDLKSLIHKKEKASSDYLERWENDNFREELTVRLIVQFVFIVVALPLQLRSLLLPLLLLSFYNSFGRYVFCFHFGVS